MKPSVVAMLYCCCQAPPALSASCDTVGDLLAFISAYSDYPVPATCPEIDRTDFIQSDAALRSQAGAFFPDSGRISLAADLDTETVIGRSYLLHELVHAAQFRVGAQNRVRCVAELEREAYALQAAWLRQHDEGREALVLGWLADGLSQCPGAANRAEY